MGSDEEDCGKKKLHVIHYEKLGECPCQRHEGIFHEIEKSELNCVLNAGIFVELR